jgi:hypothetical protein
MRDLIMLEAILFVVRVGSFVWMQLVVFDSLIVGILGAKEA